METVPRSDGAAYMRAYRESRPAVRRRGDLYSKAYAKAVRKLKVRHLPEWRELLAEAKREVGL